jgi:predicted AAA+ superfamily ATPase
LLELGGFPEPFFSSSSIEAKRWSREYRTRLIQDDIFTLEEVIDLGNIELLSIRLPQLVGAPLSINSLREDLNLSHKTVAKWLDIFERVYSIFRLLSFGAPKIRAVKKERKHYHFDWTLIENKPLRFENMIAMHLYKWCAFKEDTEGDSYELRYFRDVDGREVDFVILKNNKPIKFIEAKWQDDELSKGLKYLKERFPECEAYQISAIGKKDYLTANGIRVCSAIEILKELI